MLTLIDKSLLSLRALVVKAGQIKRCYGLGKLGRHVVAMRIPHNVCFGRLHLKEQ